eukprot:9484092-Pyramimonas_sp.AAC.1
MTSSNMTWMRRLFTGRVPLVAAVFSSRVPLVAASDPTSVAAYVCSLRTIACVTRALTRALNSQCP